MLARAADAQPPFAANRQRVRPNPSGAVETDRLSRTRPWRLFFDFPKLAALELKNAAHKRQLGIS
jgi:hypothetical protein